MLKYLYPLLRPLLSDWLAGRALRIPAAQVHSLAVKFGIPDASVTGVEDAVASAVVAQLDSKFGYKA